VGFPTERANMEALILGVVAVCTIALDVPVNTDVAIIGGAQRFIGELCLGWFSVIELDWGGVLFM